MNEQRKCLVGHDDDGGWVFGIAITSYWRPLEGTDPYIGKAGEISCEPEIKAEVTVFKEKVDETIEAIKKVHPYEEPVINVIPIWRTSF